MKNLKIFVCSALVLVGVAFVSVAKAATFDSNVPANIKQQMIDDMEFMRSIKGPSVTPLHQQIFGDMDGQKYVTWFDTRVKAIGMNACGGGNAVACVFPMIASKMFITQNYIKFSHPQISRLMVVFHEARHTERNNGNWGHATCPSPFLDQNGQPMKSIWTGAPLAGEAACDVTPFGSYGSSTILLKNVQKNCESCTEKVRQDAGMYADNQLGRVTNANAKQQMLNDFATGAVRARSRR